MDLGKSIFESGMSYVELSRAVELYKLENIYFSNFIPGKLFCNELAINEYNRLYIKNKLLNETFVKFNIFKIKNNNFN
jgi:hypothetical protein